MGFWKRKKAPVNPTGIPEWVTPGPRDIDNSPVELDECGHFVLDYDRMWREMSHPTHPVSKEVYARYDREHRGSFWFKRNT